MSGETSTGVHQIVEASSSVYWTNALNVTTMFFLCYDIMELANKTNINDAKFFGSHGRESLREL